jgi:toxin ParE1/3/4
MHELVISSQAEAEVVQAAQWYERERAGLGGDFLAEADVTLRRIASGPLQFPCVRRAPEVRRALLARFPYHVWFYLEADGVRVFAVLHAKRDPGELQTRRPE